MAKGGLVGSLGAGMNASSGHVHGGGAPGFRTWMTPFLLIPVLPKVKVLSLGATVILLDDFVLLLSMALAIAWLVAQAVVSGSLRLSFSRPGLLFLALIAYKATTLAVLAVVLPSSDLEGIGSGVLLGEGLLVLGKSSIFLLIYLLLFTHLRTIEALHKAIYWYLVCVSVVAAIGLLQFFYLGHDTITSTFRNIYLLGEPMPIGWGVDDPWFEATAVGHEHLGAFMILAASVLAGMLLCGWPEKKIHRFSIQVLCASCVIGIIFSSSRGTWIGASMAMVVLVVLSLRGGRFSHLLIALIIAALGLVLLQWWKGVDLIAYVENRVVGLLAMWDGKIEDDSGKHRLNLLWWLLGIFWEHPLIGLGPGGAGRIAEGQWIRELVEGGIVGTVIFIFIMVRAGLIALSTYDYSSDKLFKGCSMGFLCGLSGLLTQSMFTELFILTKVATPFWVVTAIVHRFYFIEQRGT